MVDDIDMSKIFSDIDKSQIVKDEEIKEIISFGDTRIELSKNLISYANNHVEMLNRQSKDVKTMVMYIVIIINLVMISLFLLMMFIVTKVCEKAEQYAFYSFVTGLPNKEFAIKTKASSEKVLKALLEAGIFGVYSLSSTDYGLENAILIAVTEKRTKEEIDKLVSVIGGVR